jgi:predicted N-acetyltransferase YhbS
MNTAIPFTIRLLTPGDAQAWAEIRREALEAHPLAFGSSLPAEFGVLVETARDRLKVSEDSAAFGAFIGKALVGTVGIRREYREKDRHKCLLLAMYVRSENRRTGVGESLVRSAIRHARSWEGVEQVLLVVNDVALDAKRLYERLGFRTWGIEPRSLNWKGDYTNAVHMIFDLREGATTSGKLTI